jgi:hypothetical protein
MVMIKSGRHSIHEAAEKDRCRSAPTLTRSAGLSGVFRDHLHNMRRLGTLYADPGVVGSLVADVAVLDVDLRVTLGPTATPEDFDVDRARVRFEPFRPDTAVAIAMLVN